MIALLNIILPHVIQLWRQAKEADPNAATYTDEQVIELLRGESQTVVDRGNAWLAELASRPTPPTP